MIRMSNRRVTKIEGLKSRLHVEAAERCRYYLCYLSVHQAKKPNPGLIVIIY